MSEASEHLAIDVALDGDTARLRLDGELDAHAAPHLASAVESAIAEGARRVTIDATELRFCDSSGIQVLVQAREQLLAQGGSLTMTGVHGTLEKVLSVTGLLDLFTSS